MEKKRIVIDIPEEEHQKIKEEAVKRNMTISRFVLQAILFYCEKVNQ